jgi:hypothetical protein
MIALDTEVLMLDRPNTEMKLDYSVRVWTGFIWLRIGISGGIF